METNEVIDRMLSINESLIRRIQALEGDAERNAERVMALQGEIVRIKAWIGRIFPRPVVHGPIMRKDFYEMSKAYDALFGPEE